MASAQIPDCKAVAGRLSGPAEKAYASGDYTQAGTLYTKAAVENLGAGLVRTLLREGKIAEAAHRADRLLAAHPESAVLLTALAEVQLRQGAPWLTAKALERSTAIDPCQALTHFVRSKVYRIDSMYSLARNEIAAAYAIDPADVEIARAWRQNVSVANDAVSIDKAISSGELDADAKRQGAARLRAMMEGMSENSQTCQVLPGTKSAVLTLLPSMRDGKNIDAYKLEVKLPQTEAVLQVDTAASGMYISRAFADRNGMLFGGAWSASIEEQMLRLVRATNGWFGTMAASTSGWLGSKWGFAAAGLFMLIWAVTGPMFHYSDTWQLVINTGTNIITFIMVFLIQNTQNRDARSMNLKLDEVIRALDTGDNQMINIEKLSDMELDELHARYEAIRTECDVREAKEREDKK